MEKVQPTEEDQFAFRQMIYDKLQKDYSDKELIAMGIRSPKEEDRMEALKLQFKIV
jgi:hypothetical protein